MPLAPLRRLLDRWEVPVAFAVVVLMIAGLFGLSELSLPLRLESLALDLRFRLRGAMPPKVPVVIVGIDDASIAELGRWPWSRTIFARLLDRMSAAGAKVVAFDLLFKEPQASPISTERNVIETAADAVLPEAADRAKFGAALSALARANDPDATLAEAIARDGQVIVPFALDLGEFPSSAPQSLPTVLEKAEYARVRGAGPDHLPRAIGLTLPIQPLASAGLLAHVTTVADATGAYRYDYPVLSYDDSYLPSLSLEAVRAFLGVARANVVVDLGHGIDIGALHVPTDDGMRLLVNYYPAGSFQLVRFADAVSGKAPAEMFEGKIVLVGATATGLGDFLATPFTASLPGIERHATVIANMLGGDFLRRDAMTVALDALFILLGGLPIGFAARRGALHAAITALALLVSLALADGYAFARLGLWLNFTFPAATIAITFLVILGAKYAVEAGREKWIREAFSRYLHPDLVDELCRSHARLRLSGEERELTVLFADIRGFSRLAQSMPATELVGLLNEFFTVMTDIVLARRGMLDKYIGDSLMAVFGAPLPVPGHAVEACRAALDMREALEGLHARWREQNKPCLNMRIGINTGAMIIGNMGTSRRLNYTVIGDEVNLAARLEQANKLLGTDILVSAATARAVADAIKLDPRGKIPIRGWEQPVEVFALPGGIETPATAEEE